MSIPALTAWTFAAAGLVCALGPILIHLLNRRRFQTVEWAAMDFLREALTRSRRIMEMRDIALLVLRTLAVLLFGLALARPFVSANSMVMWAIVFPALIMALLLLVLFVALWSVPVVRWLSLLGSMALFAIVTLVLSMQIGVTEDSEEGYDGSQPLHAIVVIDNSMSMGYQSLDGDLLDIAKSRAKQFIERLPEGSPVSIVPACGSSVAVSADPYTKTDALEIVDRIDVVDRGTNLREISALANQASLAEPHLAKRIVVVTDQQLNNWDGLSSPDQFEDFPEMQIVNVVPGKRENTWISDLRIEDGLADVETPTTFIVELRHQGPNARDDMRVSLSINGTEVASKTESIEAGNGVKEVRFEYLFNSLQVEPGQPEFVPVTASISPDHLPADDQRTMVAHVVAALPVVFVDQYGEDREDVSQNRIGESKPLHNLLAPVTSRGERSRQLVKIRHRRIDQIDRDLLADARLVVIAGVENPSTTLPLLREYVEQGGKLVIAAGADFNPQLWNEADEEKGAGVLPAPLEPQVVGQLPSTAAKLQPLTLSYDSLQSHYYFRLADTSEEQLQELYSLPFFFRYVDVNVNDDSLAKIKEREKLHIERRMNSSDSNSESSSSWLLWDNGVAPDIPEVLPEDPDARELLVDELVDRTRPRVLARFENPERSPYIVERRVGRGTVMFLSSGLRSNWNTLRTTDTILMFDRILRSMIESTLPARNFSTQQAISLPVKTTDREVQLALWRPDDETEPEILDTGFIGRDVRGFSVSNSFHSGLYLVEELDPAATTNSERTVLHETPLAVNCVADESTLQPLEQHDFETRTAGSPLRWVGATDEISLQGVQSQGQDFYWMVLIVAVILFLLSEIAILAWPNLKKPQTS